MKVKTSRFGEIEVRDDSRLTIVGGLLGFYGLDDFVEYRPEGLGIFRWLQSVDIPQLAFVVCNAAVICQDYQISVKAGDVKSIGLDDASGAEVWTILTYPQDPSRMTANLLGPIVVNRQGRLARQVVLEDEEYSSRHVVFRDLKERREAGGGSPASRQECA